MTKGIRSLRSVAFALVLVAAAGVAPGRAQTIQTSAHWALLMDVESGSVLFQKDADAPMPPASMIKLLTAELVFKEIAEGRISLDTEFRVSEFAWRTGGAVSRGSTMFARVGESIRVSDLLRGLIVQAGNDAAIVLAEGVAGSEGAFVGMMNRRARELGMHASTIMNSWGRSDPGQTVTARDLARLAAHVVKTYPDLYKLFAETEFTWSKIKQSNRNPLLGMSMGADGLITGNSDEQTHGLVGSAVQDGQRLVLVVNGLKNVRERAEEARKLMNWGFRAFDVRDAFAAGETIGSAMVYGGEQRNVPLVARRPVRLLTPRGSSERVSARIEYLGPLLAPVEAGRRVADLRVYRGKELALDMPLYTAAEVKTGPLYSRAFDAAYEYTVALVRKYVAPGKK